MKDPADFLYPFHFGDVITEYPTTIIYNEDTKKRYKEG